MKIDQSLDQLIAKMAMGEGASIGDVLMFATDNDLILRDDRMQDGDDGLAGVLAAPASEVLAYHRYIEGQSAYATQHGVKGAEFPSVIVVLDDEEGRYNLYSYEKLLGIRPMSDTDAQNVAEGRDSVMDRTRRLFYVACSRAREHLAVVLFVQDPRHSAEIIRGLDVFPPDAIHVVEK